MKHKEEEEETEKKQIKTGTYISRWNIGLKEEKQIINIKQKEKKQITKKTKQNRNRHDETLVRRSGALCLGVVSGCSLPFCKQTNKKETRKQTNKQPGKLTKIQHVNKHVNKQKEKR